MLPETDSACPGELVDDGCCASSKLRGLGADDGVEEQFVLLPNPMGNRGTLAITLPVDDRVQLSIHQLNGTLVQQLEPATVVGGATTQVELNTRELANGLYLLKITHSKGTSYLKLLRKR